MRKHVIVITLLLALALVLVTVGCDSGGAPAPTPSPSPSPTSPPTATAEPTPIATPTPAPTAPLTPSPTPTAAPTLSPTPTAAPLGTEPPCRFHGTVRLNGANVPDGTVITVMVADDGYTTTTPAVAYGPSTYAIKIVPAAGAAYAEGTPVTFMIHSCAADQTASWEKGGNIELNLTAST